MSSSSLEDQLEQALAEYREKRASLRDVQARLSELSSTAKAPRNTVSVTVDAHGRVTDVSFPVNAYKKMAPAELATAVRETISQAQAAARTKLAELIEPMTPAGIPTPDLRAGRLDFDAMFPANPNESAFLSGFNDIAKVFPS